MTNVTGASNFLNTQQLMNISDNIVGITKENNSSIFSDVQTLDSNRNETIDRPEAGISKLISLGNTVLSKLANLFGIELNKPTESQPLETFEDAQNEQIVDKYFKPITDKASNVSDEHLKNGALDNMISKEQIQYTFKSILAEKEANGVNIIDTKTDDNRKTISFDDGSTISIDNDNSQIFYSATASDGSKTNAKIQTFNGNNSNQFSIRHSADDENGASTELLNSLVVGQEIMPDGSIKDIYTEGAEEIINQHSNAEIYSTKVNYSHSNKSDANSNTEQIRLSNSRIHTQENQGEATSEVEANTKKFTKTKELHEQ